MYYTIKCLSKISKVKRIPLRIFRNPCGTYYAIVFDFRKEYSLVWRSRNFSCHQLIEKQLSNYFMEKVHAFVGGVFYV